MYPAGGVTVSLGEWQAAFYKLDRERESTASRHAFNRASNGLVNKEACGHMELDDGRNRL